MTRIDGRLPRTRFGRIALAVAVAASLSVIALVGREARSRFPAGNDFRTASGELLGGDFLAFYTGGRLYDRHRDRLYDLDFQRDYRERLLPGRPGAGQGELPFVYPPLVAAVAAPFSRLPFRRAFYLWTAVGFVCSVGSLLWIGHVSGATKVVPSPLVFVFILAYVPLSIDTFFGGQIAWLGIAVLAFTAGALLRGRELIAGGLMSLSYYKPPIFLLAVVALLVARRARFALGFGLGAATLLGLSLLVMDPGGLSEYASTVSRYTYGQELAPGVQLPESQGAGLAALSMTWTSSMELTIALLGLPFLAVVYLCRKLLSREHRGHRLFGLVLCFVTTVAVSLQCIKYDLALLLVPMILAVAWLGRRPAVGRILLLVPLVGFYLEFAFRQLGPGASVINLSSILFVLLVPLLAGYGWLLIEGKESTVERGLSRIVRSG